MRLHRCTLLLVFFLLISACESPSSNPLAHAPDNASASGIPTPTPFQPLTENAADTAYAGAAPTPVDLPTVTPLPPTPVPIVVQPEWLPAGVSVPEFVLSVELNPLTGLPPTDPALMDRRPLAIKVANYPRYIRPQSGLTLADNIFEYYIEGGLTRFIAVFYSNDSEWVGPVRSGRYFDENIQRMYHAYLVFKFADPRVEGYLQSSDIAPFLVVPGFGKCPPFHLMDERKIEVYNNSYFNTIEWKDCVSENGLENHRQGIRLGFFNEEVPPPDLLGLQMFTYYSEYSYNYWLYDSGTREYYRFQERGDIHDGKEEKYDPLVDRVTGGHVHAANIVYLMAHHTFSNTFDEEDEVYQIDLTGSGEAYVFRDGVGMVARWIRTNTDQPLLLVTPGGAPIYLRPGITFYQVLGSASYVDQDAGQWDFHHATP
ncbi:MAG TPA: DUF3048 domain-containing protein [Anaerolineales bacterium]|nr:DUF3048 domain-containing protein [Anaerolineales bacterium]